MAELLRDFWIRETGTGQQVAQIHDRYMMKKKKKKKKMKKKNKENKKKNSRIWNSSGAIRLSNSTLLLGWRLYSATTR